MNISKKSSMMSIAALSTLAITAAANAETRDYDVASFNAIKAAQGMDVTVSIGDTQSINAEGPDGKMDRLSISVKDGTLIIKRAKKRGGWGWNRDSTNFSINVVATSLSSIDTSSGARVDATGITAELFSIDTSSGSNVSASGSCTNLTVDASSGSRIDAENLTCKNAVADVSSGASIDLHASSTFSGDASSGGDIDVYGNPTTVNTDESSGGDIDLR